jgi:hypothetical protein
MQRPQADEFTSFNIRRFAELVNEMGVQSSRRDASALLCEGLKTDEMISCLSDVYVFSAHHLR